MAAIGDSAPATPPHPPPPPPVRQVPVFGLGGSGAFARPLGSPPFCPSLLKLGAVVSNVPRRRLYPRTMASFGPGHNRQRLVHVSGSLGVDRAQ